MREHYIFSALGFTQPALPQSANCPILGDASISFIILKLFTDTRHHVSDFTESLGLRKGTYIAEPHSKQLKFHATPSCSLKPSAIHPTANFPSQAPSPCDISLCMLWLILSLPLQFLLASSHFLYVSPSFHAFRPFSHLFPLQSVVPLFLYHTVGGRPYASYPERLSRCFNSKEHIPWCEFYHFSDI